MDESPPDLEVVPPRQPATFRSYLRTCLIATVLMTVGIISSTLYYFLNKALESQFLARAEAEKNLAEEIIKDRFQGIKKSLRDLANNNTVKITLMLGVKPQLKGLLLQICPPRDGAHYFVHGGPDKEFFPKDPHTLIRLIQTAGSHKFESIPYLFPDQWTLIFSQPIKRNEERVGTAYCVYNLSQDDPLGMQLRRIGNNWFYFLVTGGLRRQDNYFRQDSSHPILTRQDIFLPYDWEATAGITSRSSLFESLYYFIPTQPLAEIRSRIIYLIGGLSLLILAFTQPFATLLTRRLGAPLQTMAAQAGAISQGEKDHGFNLPGKQFAEFQQLSQTFNHMLQQLRVAQEDSRYKELFDHVTDIVWIQDMEGNILETNEVGYQVLGYSRAELLGLDIKEVCSPGELTQVVKTLEAQGEAAYEEHRQNRQGGKIPFAVKAKKIFYKNAGCILTVARDITQDKRAEEELLKNHRDLQETSQRLEQSRNMLQLIIESIPVRVFWKDKDLRYLGCNTLFAHDAGLSRPEQLLGLDDFKMGWREQAELYRADDRQVIASGLPKMNIIEPQTTPAGANIWLHTSKVPLQRPSGEVFGVLGVYEDITERKRTEEALRASLAEKEVLLREIHHRVKNNLQIVVSLLSMQSRAMKEPRVQAMLKDCQTRVHSMALVHEALYRSGNLAQINLQEYLRSLGKAIMSSYSSGRKIKFLADLEPIQTNVETAIPCGLILAELLSNALKYAFPDNRAGEILLSLRKNAADEIVLTIRDDGVGIPADMDLTSVGSLGLKLVTDLAQFQLGGKMFLKRDPGTEIEIIFKELTYLPRT